MRILYLASVDIPHRKARTIQIVNTAHALARAGARVTLVGGRLGPSSVAGALAPFGLRPNPRLRVVRVPIARVPAAFDRWYTRVWQASYLTGLIALLPGLLIQERPDVLLVRDLRLAWLLCRLLPAVSDKLVFEAHDLGSLEAELAGDLATAHRLAATERVVFSRARSIVAITDQLRQLIGTRHGIAIERIAVVPDGTSDPGPERPPDTERAGVTYVGQLYPWKGVDTLIAAMAEAPALTCTIVGGTESDSSTLEPDIQRLRDHARELQIAERVQFTGWVPYRAVGEHLRHAAIAVIPLPDSPFGRYFTSPLKLFDYMAAGATILASDLPTIREVVTHGVNGWLVPPDDPVALAAALRTLTAAPEHARSLAHRAFDDVHAYTWDARAQRLLRVLHDGT